MTETALAVMTLTDMMTLGETFARSGFFADAKQAAQAVVKIQAGRELGFPPMMSMVGVNIVMGKVSISAGLMGALVKKSKRYDYRIKTLTDTACVLEFTDNGQLVYTSTYTLEDAKRAGIGGKDMWQKYPKNMLFARTLSNGARFVCPDVVAGVYTPDELGLVVDGDGNAVIEGTATPVETPDGNGHEPQVQDKASMPFADYIKDSAALGRFWGVTKTAGMAEADVYAALGCAHLHDIPPAVTVGQVWRIIQSWGKIPATHDDAPNEPDEALP